MIVYKYIRPDEIIISKVLEEMKIRFTQPSALNDPFECFPCMTQVRDHWKNHAQSTVDSTLDEFMVTFRERVGILSLSKKWNNLLMWSHYGDSHKGFVLGFDRDDDFFAAEPGKTALKEVRYLKLRPVMLLPTQMNESEKLELMSAIHLTKHPDWKYEKEMRSIAKVEFADETKIKGNNKICLFKFPKDCVKEIILGCEMESSNIQKIIKICQENYPSVKIFKADLGSSSKCNFG